MIRKLCEPFLSIFIIAALFFIFASAVVQAEEFKLVGKLITKVIKGLSENPKNNTKIEFVKKS